ncbi:MAG: hypothetical protein ACRYFU_16280 [Janthinobacterium lividum]
MPKSLTIAALLALSSFPFAAFAQTESQPPPATIRNAALVASTSALPDESLPDAPGVPSVSDPQGSGAPTQSAGDPKQTSRILGIIPNFRSVSVGSVLPPQTVKDKFKTGLADSFDYSAFVFVGIQAGIAQATDSYPAFHQGAAGYARYYWHTFADQADENLLVESVFPSVFHEDSRYYTLGHGGFIKRSSYALSRALITRTDSGGETFNVAEIGGAASAASISAAYYPAEYRTWTKVGQRWLTNVILDTATLYVREFWPDINNAFSHKKVD